MPPAQLALATILQAYPGGSDAEVLAARVMDRRWQWVLDCLDCAPAPCGKATRGRFRAALIAHGRDRRLVERPAAPADRDGGFGARPRRVALAVAPPVRAQDVVAAPDAPARLRPGVATDRRIAVADGQLRHGRKRRAGRFDGYKRHGCRDLAPLVGRAVGITAANQPDATVTASPATPLMPNETAPDYWTGALGHGS